MTDGRSPRRRVPRMASGRPQPCALGPINVEKGHMDPHFGEGDPQWEADVPAAADYAYRRFHLEGSFPQIRFWHFGTVHYR